MDDIKVVILRTLRDMGFQIFHQLWRGEQDIKISSTLVKGKRIKIMQF